MIDEYQEDEDMNGIEAEEDNKYGNIHNVYQRHSDHLKKKIDDNKEFE